MTNTFYAETNALCMEYTALAEEEIAVILRYAACLQEMADLANTDMFIDCLCKEGGQAVIVAEAHPHGGRSLYREKTMGKFASPENEPGVFATFRDGVMFHGLRALTQENISVRQDVVPLKGEKGQVIAVLIKEKDVTSSLSRSMKYDTMLQTNLRLQKELDALQQPAADGEEKSALLQLKEANHRIKNNLQMLAALMSMEARNAKQAETQAMLQKNVSRILTIASIHDILNQSELAGQVDLQSLFQRILAGLEACRPEERDIRVKLEGVTMQAPADVAVALALVVNELVTNAYKHAFCGRQQGTIVLLLEADPGGMVLTVQDDGTGFSYAEAEKGIGLQIVEMMVKEKLKGNLFFSSADRQGTQVRIEF